MLARCINYYYYYCYLLPVCALAGIAGKINKSNKLLVLNAIAVGYYYYPINYHPTTTISSYIKYTQINIKLTK